MAQIKAIAAERGYDTKETVKAKIIAEFLTQQG
uniref:Ribbon-helix-helix protein, copG family n=1 Tax=Siphoviridae sp. ctwQg18 TaxID=2826516 RepID=A0A8S5MIU9_9CAUD|nr:MAG TPA: Ribbon-helix-helix protein, copG family [Siphoviridae sp. ctwQg18]DAD82223.1 MAG TPA: Ribbon-helix-helix protein, copG family [Siphoviridae sp. ctwQg18]